MTTTHDGQFMTAQVLWHLRQMSQNASILPDLPSVFYNIGDNCECNDQVIITRMR